MFNGDDIIQIMRSYDVILSCIGCYVYNVHFGQTFSENEYIFLLLRSYVLFSFSIF